MAHYEIETLDELKERLHREHEAWLRGWRIRTGQCVHSEVRKP